MKNRETMWPGWTQAALMAILVVGFLGGCCSKTMVVLLPESDGSVGKAMVKSKQSSATLTLANESARVGAPGQFVENTGVLDVDQVQKIFSEALEAQPVPPRVFLLYFKSGGTGLTEESLSLMPDILESICQRQSTDISVVGHTDSVGSSRINRQLSIKRARVVVDVLGASGVDVSLVEISSHGENNPVVPTADNVAEPKNRRVEVVVR